MVEKKQGQEILVARAACCIVNNHDSASEQSAQCSCAASQAFKADAASLTGLRPVYSKIPHSLVPSYLHFIPVRRDRLAPSPGASATSAFTISCRIQNFESTCL